MQPRRRCRERRAGSQRAPTGQARGQPAGQVEVAHQQPRPGQVVQRPAEPAQLQNVDPGDERQVGRGDRTRGSSSSATTAARGSSGIQITRGGDVGSRTGYRPRARPSRRTRHDRTGRRLSQRDPVRGLALGRVRRRGPPAGLARRAADERHEPCSLSAPIAAAATATWSTPPDLGWCRSTSWSASTSASRARTASASTAGSAWPSVSDRPDNRLNVAKRTPSRCHPGGPAARRPAPPRARGTCYQDVPSTPRRLQVGPSMATASATTPRRRWSPVQQPPGDRELAGQPGPAQQVAVRRSGRVWA